MVSHPETGSDSPIGSDRESGHDTTGGRFLVADGQHDFTILPYVWPVPLALPPYPGASEGIGLPGIDSLGCWSW